MATAKKLPSGSWRCQVFSHFETTTDKDGSQKKKRIYKSFTCDIPILLAAFGPMRRGEICALDSDHINGNIVHVEYSMAMDEHHNWVKKSPKTISGNRYIEFPDFVAEKLKNIKGNVTNLTPSQISDRFIDVIARTGVSKFRFHDLQHPYVKPTTKNKLAAKAEIPNYQHEFDSLRFLLFCLDVQVEHDKQKPYSSNVTYVS